MNTIPIHIPAPPPQSYEVRIAPNLLPTLGTFAQSLAPSPTAAIITDSNVAPLYLQTATTSLQTAGYRVIPHIIPAGEQNKTLHTASLALEVLLQNKVERSTPVIALGGGVVGDLAGFVSATLLRGTPFIQCPTTLLAAVDASIGGKVGVDHPAGKNLIGAFHQPKIVLTDIATFATLPPRLKAGLAECVKHAVIRDASLFAFITTHLEKILARDPATLADLVAQNVAIKAVIVHEDPFEKSVRALLNFGHTFGHALETITHYRVSHGEAVALGMLAAARLATSRNEFPADDLQKLTTLLQAIGLPTTLPDLNVDQAFAAMATDKKVQSGKLRLILPTKIGHAHIVTDIPPDQIRTALASLAPDAPNPPPTNFTN